MQNGKIKRNFLSRPQARKVENWMEDNWKLIEQERMSQSAAASKASADLGFSVTLANLQGAAKVLERYWRSRGRQVPPTA